MEPSAFVRDIFDPNAIPITFSRDQAAMNKAAQQRAPGIGYCCQHFAFGYWAAVALDDGDHYCGVLAADGQ